jgi:ATP-dependent Clp protease ATP-binding subunit ClpA
VATLSVLLRRAGRSSGPKQGLEAIATLRQELEALERHHVAAAVAQEWSWSAIAGALGVSKQAAHKKHARAIRALAAAAEGEEVPSDARVVVTPQAREVVRCARDEARAVGSTIVGTEHLLLGVLRAGAPRELRILRGEGVDVESARECLQPTLAEEDRAIAVTESDTAAAAAATGVSPLARACLESSLRETVRRGDRQLTPKHVLLALVSRADGGAARTLQSLGTSAETIRRLLEAGAAR